MKILTARRCKRGWFYEQDRRGSRPTFEQLFARADFICEATIESRRNVDVGLRDRRPSRGSIKRVVIAVAFVAAGSASMAQRPAFEVATIKVSPLPETTPTVMARQVAPDRWSATYADPERLIAAAFPEYALPGHIGNVPPSIAQRRFDIAAKAPSAASAEQMRLMVLGLLEERFGFRYHIAKGPVEVYALVHARDDRRLGRGLTPAAADCSAWAAAIARNESPPAPPAPDPARPSCGIRTDSSTGVLRFHGGGVTMDTLAARLEGFPKQHRAPVENRTGLDGRYDIISFVFGLQTVGSDPIQGSRLEDALEDQLGLKLELRRESRDVLIVDRFEMPTPD